MRNWILIMSQTSLENIWEIGIQEIDEIGVSNSR